MRYLVLGIVFLTINSAAHARSVELTDFSAPRRAAIADERTAMGLSSLVSIDTARRSFLAFNNNPLQPQARNNSTSSTCLSARYAPAPWLSPEVERRRQLHYEAIVQVACEVGLSSSLLDAVVLQESGYRALAISRAGARGLMQLMPATAQDLGIERSFDPLANLRGGARYLGKQLQHFRRIDLALAAYNAGPQRASLRQGRIPAIAETRAYVRSVTGNWERFTKHSSPTGIAQVDRRQDRDQRGGRTVLLAHF